MLRTQNRFRHFVHLAFVSCLICLNAYTFRGTPSFAGAYSSKTILKCQKSLAKAGSKLYATALAAEVDCARRLIGCQLEEELDGASFSACADKARLACNKGLNKIEAKRSALIAAADVKCSALAARDLTSLRGIGFRSLADACSSLVPPAAVGDRTQVADCLVRLLECRSADALETIAPRAYEVLERAGLRTAYGEALACLDARPPSPAGGEGPAAKALAGCQHALGRTMVKRLKAEARTLHRCATGLLRCQLPVDRAEQSIPAGQTCAEAFLPKCESKLGKLDRIASVAAAKIADKCAAVGAADAAAALGFAEVCPGAGTIEELVSCSEAQSRQALDQAVAGAQPRTCRLLESAGRLNGFEPTCIPLCGNGVVEAGESCDDGNGDDVDSCRNDCTPGPTAFETVSVASPAKPAHTPDGTAANAVPPGSTLATQFGSTIFDLNRAQYVRFYLPGAGDPNAVLILVPGFAGGGHSFKYLAENLLVRSLANPNLTLEVWAFDRRTDFLEDDAGAVLADAASDPLLAANWYFGAELGLPLDPRLSRRAVFHEGSDVAFLANFTWHVFVRDIDAVVEAARSLPGSPKVFLGGHSLGTTFAARYAATDFDPGPGVEPGYAKLAGLVLFEGGGDSLPAAAPSDDDLDRIIAKADGGLYYAVLHGDARCVDGTPCPGGDADCASVPLPPGALTNKCVEPVEAYTGADPTAPFVPVTPQVHAAGDIIGIQGRVDPDGLALLQQDFGTGSLVEAVPGLGLLDKLPLASSQAAVGFFLDDDFSPISAFQASLGYSNNGLNLNLLGFVLPQPAFPPDPYRLWINIDEPMPPDALPNNGLPGGPFAVNGQEKEVTKASVLFAMLRTGEPNFGDWYFASSGLSTTAELSGGEVFSGGLDSTPLSVGRGRPDIENLTQAAAIDIPVICFGGTNGLTPTPGAFKAFAESIGTCTAPSCTGTTPRVVNPLPINTVYGGVDGGFEVYLNEGYAHIDVVSAEDDPSHNNVYGPLMAFLERNTQ